MRAGGQWLATRTTSGVSEGRDKNIYVHITLHELKRWVFKKKCNSNTYTLVEKSFKTNEYKTTNNDP